MGENKPELVALEANPSPLPEGTFYTLNLRPPLAEYIRREIDIAAKAKAENSAPDNLDNTLQVRQHIKKLREISAKFTLLDARIDPNLTYEQPVVVSDEEYSIIKKEVKNRFPEDPTENRIYTEMMDDFETKFQRAKVRKSAGELAGKLTNKLLNFKPNK